MSWLRIIPAAVLVFVLVLCVLMALAPECTVEENARSQRAASFIAAGAAALLFVLLAATA